MVDSQPVGQRVGRWWLHLVRTPRIRVLKSSSVELVHVPFILRQDLYLVQIQGVIAGHCLLVQRSLRVLTIRLMLSLLDNLGGVHRNGGVSALADNVRSGTLEVGDVFDGGDRVPFELPHGGIEDVAAEVIVNDLVGVG